MKRKVSFVAPTNMRKGRVVPVAVNDVWWVTILSRNYKRGEDVEEIGTIIVGIDMQGNSRGLVH